MRSINKIISKFLFSIIATLAVTNSIAQETGATATTTSSNNLLEILMGVIALVLAFVVHRRNGWPDPLGRKPTQPNRIGKNRTGTGAGFVAAILAGDQASHSSPDG